MDSPILDVVINWGTVASATVLLGFILNQGYVFLAKALRSVGSRLSFLEFLTGLPKSLAAGTKKAVVYISAVVLTVSFADFSVVLPDASDPSLYVSAVIAYSTTVFKFAQEVYDVIWTRLIAGK
ncbi:hypothetical protein LCGC14_0593100 [marine sediment metagenome]|uniref:Uncharacterized protein n=1 Tax=marine sediment metagenome TaxID=412755 RepID=A0A0F9RWJ6_9ZZZZ